MSKTKDNILDKALHLFNAHGVADVSIRQIAKEAGISHGNLMYHFKSREEIVRALHGRLLRAAVRINEGLLQSDFDLPALLDSTVEGFEIVYDYRFLFYDLLYISKSDPEMRATLLEIEQIRSHMYREVILQTIRKGWMREEEFASEYDHLIQRIKLFSDHWPTSAAIYESGSKPALIAKYARLLFEHFYPYLTPDGKAVLKAGNRNGK